MRFHQILGGGGGAVLGSKNSTAKELNDQTPFLRSNEARSAVLGAEQIHGE